MIIKGIELLRDEVCECVSEIRTPGWFGGPDTKTISDVMIVTNKRFLVCSRGSFGKLLIAGAVGSTADNLFGLGRLAATFLAGSALGALKSSSQVKVKVNKIKHEFSLGDIVSVTETAKKKLLGVVSRLDIKTKSGEELAIWFESHLQWDRDPYVIMLEHGTKIYPSSSPRTGLADLVEKWDHALRAFTITPLPGEKKAMQMYLPETKDELRPNVTIAVQDYFEDIEDYIALTNKQFADENYKAIESRQLDALIAVFEYSFSLEGIQLHGYAKAVKSGHSKVFLTTAIGSELYWSEISPQLKACVDSFQLV